MLSLIHQNGSQKIETSSYWWEEVEDGSDYHSFNIIALIKDAGPIAVAAYDQEKDARAIFAHMVVLEMSSVLAVLPRDNELDIKTFLTTSTTADALNYLR